MPDNSEHFICTWLLQQVSRLFKCPITCLFSCHAIVLLTHVTTTLTTSPFLINTPRLFTLFHLQDFTILSFLNPPLFQQWKLVNSPLRVVPTLLYSLLPHTSKYATPPPSPPFSPFSICLQLPLTLHPVLLLLPPCGNQAFSTHSFYPSRPYYFGSSSIPMLSLLESLTFLFWRSCSPLQPLKSILIQHKLELTAYLFSSSTEVISMENMLIDNLPKED